MNHGLLRKNTAIAAGSSKTLATALTSAGLVSTMKGAGPFTVFAPTDEALTQLTGRFKARSAQTFTRR
ncbi:MAG TPA: fasciclin domain-containing protein [Terriglobales bacterium]|nr:fasciclin domain-containing protein [Terriglobales bacterium]